MLLARWRCVKCIASIVVWVLGCGSCSLGEIVSKYIPSSVASVVIWNSFTCELNLECCGLFICVSFFHWCASGYFVWNSLRFSLVVLAHSWVLLSFYAENIWDCYLGYNVPTVDLTLYWFNQFVIVKKNAIDRGELCFPFNRLHTTTLNKAAARSVRFTNTMLVLTSRYHAVLCLS